MHVPRSAGRRRRGLGGRPCPLPQAFSAARRRAPDPGPRQRIGRRTGVFCYMTKRMLIDATHAEETRVVVLDGNRLEDFD
ncbi:MAG: hypothetical protein KGI51_16030, partial [Rhodospirillales bacterium]|nr:hypothetical protein [Rhodospirillales bacterium]